jgi:glutathione-regulated potassium-efflux system ancillary protein KefG
MANILILLAHPLLEKSRVHTELLSAIKTVKGVTVNDLYESYPDFDINVEREKMLLLDHDIIIWQHPFYWYSAPPILKQWQDLVLVHGWAYGKRGTALSGKKIFNVLSSGADQEAYNSKGFNKYAIHEFLRPFERTAELCRMKYWPPFWIHGVHRLELKEIQEYCQQYKNIIAALASDLFSEEKITSKALLNDVFPTTTNNS